MCEDPEDVISFGAAVVGVRIVQAVKSRLQPWRSWRRCGPASVAPCLAGAVRPRRGLVWPSTARVPGLRWGGVGVGWRGNPIFVSIPHNWHRWRADTAGVHAVVVAPSVFANADERISAVVRNAGSPHSAVKSPVGLTKKSGDRTKDRGALALSSAAPNSCRLLAHITHR